MNIYQDWVSFQGYYAVHLFLWMLPVVILQWVVGFRILLVHWRELILVPLVLGTYLIATDVVAVAQGVWFFDNKAAPGWPEGAESLILGWKPFGVPIEEWAFFYLTALLVVQSFLLFLPKDLRRSSPASMNQGHATGGTENG
jgi:lycopene cyclase domain-containing protein